MQTEQGVQAIEILVMLDKISQRIEKLTDDNLKGIVLDGMVGNAYLHAKDLKIDIQPSPAQILNKASFDLNAAMSKINGSDYPDNSHLHPEP